MVSDAMWVHRDSKEAQGPDLSLLRGGLVGFGYMAWFLSRLFIIRVPFFLLFGFSKGALK